MGAAAVPALIGAGGSILGGMIGGNAQDSAASTAANAQMGLEQNQFNQLQGQESNYRNQIQQMLPYLNGPEAAAAGMQTNAANGANYLSPGVGSTFGGQTLGANGSPTAGATGFNGTYRTHMPNTTTNGASGVPMAGTRALQSLSAR